MKFTPKQEMELGEKLQACLDHAEAIKLVSPTTTAHALFVSTLLMSLDHEGVPGAVRILLRLQSLDMEGVK